MPEPRKPGEMKGTKTTGRTKLLGPGGKRIEPEASPVAPRVDSVAPAAQATPERPPWDNGGLHVGCGGQFKNLALASPRRRCKACGEEWAWLRDQGRWERVE